MGDKTRAGQSLEKVDSALVCSSPVVFSVNREGFFHKKLVRARALEARC
jgi:hypothetical protein